MNTKNHQCKKPTTRPMDWTEYDPLALKLGRFLLAFSFLERNLRFRAASNTGKNVNRMNFTQVLSVVENTLSSDLRNKLSDIKKFRNLLAHGRFGTEEKSTDYFILNMNGGISERYTLLDLDVLINETIKLSHLEAQT